MFYVYSVQWHPINEYELFERQETEVLDVALALAYDRLQGWMEEGDSTVEEWGYKAGRPYIMVFPTDGGDQTDLGVGVFGLRWTDPLPPQAPKSVLDHVHEQYLVDKALPDYQPHDVLTRNQAELFEDLIDVLDQMDEYWRNGTPVHPGSLLVNQATELLARAQAHRKAVAAA